MVSRSIALFAVLRGVAFAQAGSVRARVVDPMDAVIPNADVELRTRAGGTLPQITRTDLSGRFSFTAVAPGTYELLVSAQGFEPHSQSIKVTEAQEIDLAQISMALAPIAGCGPPRLEPPTIDFEATKSGQTLLDGAVVGTGGEFLAGVMITLSPIGKNTHQWKTVTGPWGSFDFSGVTPGMYSLRATRRGYADFVIDRFEIKAGQRTHMVDSLEMLNCLKRFRCEPNRKVHSVVLCL